MKGRLSLTLALASSLSRLAELFVTARLPKDLPARFDAMKGAARRHGLDTRIEQLFGRVQILRHDSRDELARSGNVTGAT